MRNAMKIAETERFAPFSSSERECEKQEVTVLNAEEMDSIFQERQKRCKVHFALRIEATLP